MRKSFALLVVCAFAFVGCESEPTLPSQINITNTNTATNNAGGGPSPSPSPGICTAISSVNVLGPASLAVGQVADLDATPKPTRPDACNVASPIQWSASPANVCELSGNTADYNTPKLRAKAAGSCVLAVSVRDTVTGLFVTGSLQVVVQ